jgi:hypothetical protein
MVHLPKRRNKRQRKAAAIGDSPNFRDFREFRPLKATIGMKKRRQMVAFASFGPHLKGIGR